MTTFTPKKRHSENRQRHLVLRCRVLPRERDEIQKRAEALGVSVAELVRQSAQDKPIARPRKRLPTVEVQALSKLCSELGKLGSNLNQIARVCNRNGRLGDPPQLEATLHALQGLMRRIMEALA